MPTQKLYYDSSYLTEFTATVTACFEDKKGFAILLDRTAFYPEGGGQPYDTGFLLVGKEKNEIFEVWEKQGDILHYASSPLPVGIQVQGLINFERRFELMQQHTGEHILSGLVKSNFGFDNVGFHLTDKDMSVDFSGALSKEDVDTLVQKSNNIILKNQQVTASFPLEVKSLDYRSKKEIDGDIRIVKAGDADLCACCGTHTATTGEVIAIVVFDAISYKGGTRLFMACGSRVLRDYISKNSACYAISHLLSSPVAEIAQAVKNKMSEVEALKQELFGIKNQLYAQWVKEVPTATLGLFSKDGLTAGEAQKLAQLINARCEIACVSALQPDDTTKICIISTVFDTNLLGRTVCDALVGKGGGKNGIFQCVVTKIGDLSAILSAVI